MADPLEEVVRAEIAARERYIQRCRAQLEALTPQRGGKEKRTYGSLRRKIQDYSLQKDVLRQCLRKALLEE